MFRDRFRVPDKFLVDIILFILFFFLRTFIYQIEASFRESFYASIFPDSTTLECRKVRRERFFLLPSNKKVKLPVVIQPGENFLDELRIERVCKSSNEQRNRKRKTNRKNNYGTINCFRTSGQLPMELI